MLLFLINCVIDQVIGCTTTTAATLHDIISAARPTVVIIEEAGEILEAHVLTSLCRSVRKVIMIGDHKQLRPKLEHYDLQKDSKKGYDFDVSLFERLVVSGSFPISVLNIQHRMRPEISEIIRLNTYPELEDASGVNGRESIRGLQRNVVFVSHAEPESCGDDIDSVDSKSRTNKFEAEMTVQFVRYLVNQGYKLSEIVILTPYLGQLVLITEMLSNTKMSRTAGYSVEIGDLDINDLALSEISLPTLQNIVGEKIRVSTIDNFQGEESKIIIASTVRSNNRNDIGFLASPERVNVLMSRARDGMFIFGNSVTLSQSRQGSRV